jgi:hypothetical protein
MPAFVREINVTYLNEGGLVGGTLDWDRSRGADFRCLATALYVIDKYSTDLSNHGTIIQLEKWLTRSSEPTAEFRETVHNTFNVMLDLVQDKKLNGVFNTPTNVSPIEFIMAVVLVAVLKDKLTPAQLSVAIGKMRTDARKKHLDIRMNSRVGKTMMEFIKGFKASKANGEGGESAGSLAKAGKKRKRQEQPTANKNGDVVMDPPAPLKGIRPPMNRRVSRDNSAISAPVVATRSHPIPSTNGQLDRLAAIRAAKDKLASTPISLPPAAPVVQHGNANFPSSSTKSKRETNSLESALMARMNPSVSMASNRAGPFDAGDVKRSRHSSPRGRSRSRSREREYERIRERDRDIGVRHRSISSERTTRRPHDGARDWDYKSHRGRDRPHPDGRRDSKGMWEDYR